MHVEKRACNNEHSTMTVASAAVPVSFREDRERADINVFHRDRKEYLVLAVKSKPVSGVDSETLLDQNVL